MSKDFITIQEAAKISHKSIQTIRRAIKAKKLKTRKQSTPQGFNYLVNYASLCETYGIPHVMKETSVKEEVVNENPTSLKAEEPKTISVNVDDLKSFSKTLEKMIAQHSEERQNFLRLINTLQEKIFVMENQINLLKEPKKKWYQM